LSRISTAKTPFQPAFWWKEHCSFLSLKDYASPIQRLSPALIGHKKAPHQAGVQLLGNSLIGNACAPGRIFELSATLLIYVLTVLVWEVLVELKSRQT
jgi:hypothetical protein